ncbi:hypothetical protein [Nocardioides sp. NPDC047086]|uniref:hypothetical protein n=1 Tax=Nocardioides sp. NPDC047086 TaxID=3154810 RepID=UPI0033C82890
MHGDQRRERISVGDRIATHSNHRTLDVANRDCWTVTVVGRNGALKIRGSAGVR